MIELMIVVAIIGILAAIAIPKFANLVRKSKEGNAKGNLGSLRSALTIYYGDMEGLYPTDLYALTINGKYLPAIPMGYAPDYHIPNAISTGWHGGCSPSFAIGDDFDTRAWAYCATPGDAFFGTLWINCTHTDTKGTNWTSY